MTLKERKRRTKIPTTLDAGSAQNCITAMAFLWRIIAWLGVTRPLFFWKNQIQLSAMRNNFWHLFHGLVLESSMKCTPTSNDFNEISLFSFFSNSSKLMDKQKHCFNHSFELQNVETGAIFFCSVVFVIASLERTEKLSSHPLVHCSPKRLWNHFNWKVSAFFPHYGYCNGEADDIYYQLGNNSIWFDYSGANKIANTHTMHTNTH